MPAQDELAGRIRLTEMRPSWRVIEAKFKDLEGEIRKRDRDYELAAVTQLGETYTLFFRLRAKPQSKNGREFQE